MILKRKNAVGLCDFDFISMIGNGAFGRVWLVKRKNVDDFYAMKIVNVIDKVTLIYIFFFLKLKF